MKSRVWLALHGVVALLPAVGAALGAPDVRLFGSEVPAEAPALSARGWQNEQVQPALQAWFEGHIGFRGVMVRTDNTVHASVIGEAKPGSYVIVGRDETLFYADDVLYMGRRHIEMLAVLQRVAVLTSGLGVLDARLRARGKRLVVVISPSKTSVYPEAVPSIWRRPGRGADLEVQVALRAGLQSVGVRYADGCAALAGKVGEERERLFTRTGRHWTALGACLVLREVLSTGAIVPSCAYEMATVDRDGSVDFDLFRLANVWRVGEGGASLPALVERGAPRAQSRLPLPRPRAIFAGTSFTWMLVDVLRPFVDAPVAAFYNTTFYDVSEGQRPLGPVDPASAAWIDYVLQRDLYVIEILETYAHGEQLISFVETLNRRLDGVE